MKTLIVKLLQYLDQRARESAAYDASLSKRGIVL